MMVTRKLEMKRERQNEKERKREREREEAVQFVDLPRPSAFSSLLPDVALLHSPTRATCLDC
jgi:hypothetical protein